MQTAEELVRDAGFDPVIVGALARGKEFEPDTAPYNTGMSGPELRRVLDHEANESSDSRSILSDS